jgi:hypothetical protein
MAQPKLIYSQHLENRLLLREIDQELPAQIFYQSQKRFRDTETGHDIATLTVNLYNKSREVMIAYVIEQDTAKLLTIHPLKTGQKENRLTSGRWRKIS